ncbi:MAG: hypothetical protein WBA45_17330 [Microthrixaceae bacterium]
MRAETSLEPAADRIVYRMMFLGLLPAVIVGALALLINPFAGLLGLIAVEALWITVVTLRTRAAVDQILRPLNAELLDMAEHPALDNLLHGLSLTGGVRMPRVRMIDTDAMNAMIVADRDRATLVVTRGLIDGLQRIELEGVLANLMARRRDGSARYSTIVTAMYGNSGPGGGARMLLDGLGEQRSVRSDMAAVDMTMYPPGLSSALAKMEAVGTAIPDAPPESLHLWMAPAMDVDEAGRILDESLVESTMQPLSLRIAVLEEL